jgi:hypothetical protein
MDVQRPQDGVGEPSDPPAGTSAGTGSSPSREALIRALFEGLPDDDRAWVLDRIRHYRALADANEVSEGRL